MTHRAWIASALFLAAWLVPGPAHADPVNLSGAGATFPYPLYTRWFEEFDKSHADVHFEYQPIGSGGGIRGMIDGSMDFGATDGPMTDEQLGSVKARIVHIPTVLGAVVPAFNVEGVSDLKLTGPLLARIFLGKVTRWNDPAIARLNPGVKLPDAPLTPVHRIDGSGTTFAFTDYLTKVSGEWSKMIGRGTVVDWPVGLGAKGNLLVSHLVQQTPGSIGYIELVYAVQAGIPFASVQNRAGTFIKADMSSVSAAAAGVKVPKDYRVSITDASGPEAYPISTFTWLLVRENDTTPRGKALQQFLAWMLDSGQRIAPELNYAPLPQSVKAMVTQTVASLGSRSGA